MPTLQQAILCTVAYADLFDYPLTLDEIQRYLWGIAATRKGIAGVLRQGIAHPAGAQPAAAWPGVLSHIVVEGAAHAGGYYTLPGREAIADLRARREHIAQGMWSKARLWSRRMAQLPFVRMVALTGSLAVGNVEPGADMDFLIVTAPDRLWVSRAAVVALTRWAARHGDVICPNYFVSERALAIRERNLYTAREFAQMIPLQGMPTYRRMCARNTWVRGYLPNAQGAPALSAHIGADDRLHADMHTISQALSEAVLQTPPGSRLEQWEMQRKLRKFHAQRETHLESSFGPDWCKGHFGDHMTRTLHAFAQRVQQVGGEAGVGWLERMTEEPAAIEGVALAA